MYNQGALPKRMLSVVFVLFVALPVFAQVSETPRIRLKQTSTIHPNGDIDTTADIIFSTRMYTQIKSLVSNTSVLARELGITGQGEEMKDLKAQYDDGRHAIKVTATILGGMKNRGKEWIAKFMDPDTYEVIEQSPTTITLLTIRELDNGVLLIGTSHGDFPDGTRNLRWDASRGGVLCEMPPPPARKDGTVEPDMRIEVRPEPDRAASISAMAIRSSRNCGWPDRSSTTTARPR